MDIKVIQEDFSISKTALYRSLCRMIFEADRPRKIENERTIFAQIVVQELIRSSRHSIDIFCRGDECFLWEDFVTTYEMRKANIERDVRFRVIASRPMGQSVKTIFEIVDANIFAPKGGSENEFPPDIFFIIVDGKSVHLEDKIPKHSGITLANNKEFAEKLQSAFTKKMERCRTIY